MTTITPDTLDGSMLRVITFSGVQARLSELLHGHRGMASWWVEIARQLRFRTTASNPWIAQRLNMGHPNYVSNLIHRSESL